MNHHNQGEAKGRNDANKKIPIVTLSNTVIEPYTVMIEPIDTTITHPTVFAIGPTVTITILTKKYLFVLCLKGYAAVQTRPLVVVHASICWVGKGGDRCGDDERGGCDEEERKEEGRVVDGED